jgi:hypothetical protein
MCEILLAYQSVPIDCNSNGVEDSCEVSMPGHDCNGNLIPDACDIASGFSHDVNANGSPDECEYDCNANGLPDAYEISAGLAPDCNGNGRLDSCDLADPGVNLITNGGFDTGASAWSTSNIDGAGGWRSTGGHPGGMFILNAGGAAASDPTIAQTVGGLTPGLSYTISGDFVGWYTATSPPSGVSFAVDVDGVTVLSAPATNTVTWRSFTVNFIASSTSAEVRFRAEANGTDNDFAIDNISLVSAFAAYDCNNNGVPDSCDIASGFAHDCNTNGRPDSCDIASGISADADSNGVPDSCQVDCNQNLMPDSYEIAQNPAKDCNLNGALDSCEIASNPALDCNANGAIDACEIAANPSADCDSNGILDACQIANGAQDKDADGRLDACEIALGDFNLDGQISAADLSDLLGLWGFPNPPYGDLNGDGAISAADLALLLGRWGPLP